MVKAFLSMVLPLETLLKRVANTECLDINQKKCFDSVFGNVLYNKKVIFERIT